MPTLETERLILRPQTMDDVDDIVKLAGDIDIVRTTLNIPYPYEREDAIAWLSTHAEGWEKKESLSLAITRRNDGAYAGGIGFTLQLRFDKAALGYWVAKPYWGKGYATEATRALIHYGFTELNLNRIEADYFANNPASGRVMQKLGMTHEGFAKQAYKKWGEYIDTERYAILKSDYSAD